MAFSLDVLGMSPRTIQLSAVVGRKHKGCAFADSKVQACDPGQQMILVIAEAAVSLHWQKVISIPLVPQLDFCIRTGQIKWNCSVVSSDLYSVLDRLDLHLPISSMRAGMKVSIVNEHLDSEMNGSASSEQRVLDVSSVLAMAHPDAFFEQCVGKRKSPDGNRAFQAETLDVQITFGFDRAACPTICCERVIHPVVARCFFQLRDQLSPSKGRAQRGDQQAMVA